MHDTHLYDDLAHALIDLTGAMNSPRQDDVLLKEAGASLDRALFPLLVRIGVSQAIGVVELAEQVGRDHSTISRQLTKLDELGLVSRRSSTYDQRVREAVITKKGARLVRSITAARRNLLRALLAHWTKEELNTLLRLNRRLADEMRQGLRDRG